MTAGNEAEHASPTASRSASSSSTRAEVLRRMDAIPGPWSVSDFANVARTGTVRRTLSRMRGNEGIESVGGAMIGRTGEEYALGDVLGALTRRDGLRFLPTPLGAVRQMGLLPPRPDGDPVRVWSDGTTGEGKPVSIAGYVIVIEKHGPRMMSWAGNPAGPLVQALRHPETRQRVLELAPDIIAGSPRIRSGIRGNFACLPTDLQDLIRDMIWI